MPSFSAQLSVNGFVTYINYLYLDINQIVDALGRPVSLTRGGKITIEFNSTDDTVVAEWMAHPTQQLDGVITFLHMHSEVPEKEIKFINAYCTELNERFDGTFNTSHMVTVITISPEKIIVGDIELDNRWPKTA